MYNTQNGKISQIASALNAVRKDFNNSDELVALAANRAAFYFAAALIKG